MCDTTPTRDVYTCNMFTSYSTTLTCYPRVATWLSQGSHVYNETCLRALRGSIKIHYGMSYTLISLPRYRKGVVQYMYVYSFLKICSNVYNGFVRVHGVKFITMICKHRVESRLCCNAYIQQFNFVLHPIHAHCMVRKGVSCTWVVYVSRKVRCRSYVLSQIPPRRVLYLGIHIHLYNCTCIRNKYYVTINTPYAGIQ